MHTLRRLVMILAALIVASHCFAQQPPKGPTQDPAPGGQSYALLIGCTQYPGLRTSQRSYDLVGPGNDVPLLEKLLREKYQFPQENIVKLTEGQGPRFRPTRANIVGELQVLAQKARRGDRVVISYSGHGSQQPDQVPPDPSDPEPDGLDEILLPSDVRHSDDGRTVPNALVDDDLHRLLNDITKTGAMTWVIIDACQSGTATRGEVSRSVPPEELVSEDALVEARCRAAGAANRGVEDRPFEIMDSVPELVAIYAALPTETTIELPLPPDAAWGSRQTYGILSYTLCYVLSNAKSPLSYRDLIDRVYAQYSGWGRTSPTPLVEGRLRDAIVLGGEGSGKRPVLLTRDTSGKLRIDAGALHGLTEGTILAVRPPAGSPDPGMVLGHVRIPANGLRVLDAWVEPCSYPKSNLPLVAPAGLPSASRCEPVLVDLGEQRMKVAVEVEKAGSARQRDADQLRKGLKAKADETTSLLLLVEDSAVDRPEWLVRVEEGGVYLVRAADLATSNARGGKPEAKVPSVPEPVRFGPAPAGDELNTWVTEGLTRVARVESLKRLAARFQNGSPGGDSRSRSPRRCSS